MYLVPLKTLLTDAVKQTFDSDYPVEQFRGVHASIEFPTEEQEYPGIWVDFAPAEQLQVAGIGHMESEGTEDGGRVHTRWRFQGHATFTIAALSSLERDMLHDEMVRVLAFGREMPQTSEFRSYIEDNEFLAVNIDFDEIATGAGAASPGTPWGTDDVIYEITISVEVFGEFVSDNVSMTLAPISAIEITGYTPEEGDPDDTW